MRMQPRNPPMCTCATRPCATAQPSDMLPRRRQPRPFPIPQAKYVLQSGAGLCALQGSLPQSSLPQGSLCAAGSTAAYSGRGVQGVWPAQALFDQNPWGRTYCLGQTLMPAPKLACAAPAGSACMRPQTQGQCRRQVLQRSAGSCGPACSQQSRCSRPSHAKVRW